MAMTPAYALAHVFLPNLVKLKGAATVMAAVDRREKVFFDPVWQQAYVTHSPDLWSGTRDAFRLAVIGLPRPTEMGEAHMAAIAMRGAEPTGRYFTLEHDYVLKTKSDRTVVCERAAQGAGTQHTKYGDGPAMIGEFATDAAAFVDAIVAVLAGARGPR